MVPESLKTTTKNYLLEMEPMHVQTQEWNGS